MNINPNRPRGIYLLPNLFTISSIFLGFYAITLAFYGNFLLASMMVFIAMLMDSLDGRVARLTNTMSAFGEQFDSMADMVSFAMAPAVIAYTWGLHSLGKFGWVVAFIYVAAVALRLARFNTQIAGSGKRYFQGLPCPSGAANVVGLVWICENLALDPEHITIAFAFLTLFSALLMVSNVRYRSFKDFDLKNHINFIFVLCLVLIVALIILKPDWVLFSFFFGYTISGPIMTLWGLRKKQQQRQQG